MLAELASLVESSVPSGYRQEAFRALARWQLRGDLQPLSPRGLGQDHPDSPPATHGGQNAGVGRLERPALGRLALGAYSGILAAPGRMLMKSLVALEVSRTQLGIEWLAPAEIERFLVERARVRSAYRTNISNALSGARQLVDRRRRGRGYEYRLTAGGRQVLDRELRIDGSL
jgi:hypothetical protein